AKVHGEVANMSTQFEHNASGLNEPFDCSGFGMFPTAVVAKSSRNNVADIGQIINKSIAADCSRLVPSRFSERLYELQSFPRSWNVRGESPMGRKESIEE